LLDKGGGGFVLQLLCNLRAKVPKHCLIVMKFLT
jgi:hypothetical protein